MKTNRTECLPIRELASARCLRKLLVPMDFSPQSTLALKYAHALAQRAGATLELLFVVEPAPFCSGVEDLPLVRQPGPVQEQPAKRNRTVLRRSG